MSRKTIAWSYTFTCYGEGRTITYGLAWGPKRDDKRARTHVKAWANANIGKHNRVRLDDVRPIKVEGARMELVHADEPSTLMGLTDPVERPK